MQERFDQFTFGVRILPDAILSAGIWLLMYYFRFTFFGGAESGLMHRFAKASILIAFATVYFFRKEGLYERFDFSSRRQDILAILRANLYSVITFVVMLYFLTPNRLSRLVLISYYVVSSFAFIGSRMIARGYLRWQHSRGKELRRVLLVGHGKAIEQFISQMKYSASNGIRFIGWADSNGAAMRAKIPVIENGQLSHSARSMRPDLIVLNYEGAEALDLQKKLHELHNDVIPIVILPDLTYSFLGYHSITFSDMPALVLNEPRFNEFAVLSKRVCDAVFAGLGLIVISPLLLGIAIGVIFSSKGPIFFWQDRVGVDGEHFRMWKFRTMRVGSHVVDGTPGWTKKDDNRCTRFGSFLRATSLDELPQLWNVFVGEMSLVGPRPEQPFYVNKFREEIPAYMLRHKVKAGITGWAQINGWRGDTSLHKRIECDLYYIRNWSIWLDFKILFLTFWKGMISKNAY